MPVLREVLRVSRECSASEPGKHLQMLAEVVRLIRVPGLCDKLTAATTPKMVLDLLDAEE